MSALTTEAGRALLSWLDDGDLSGLNALDPRWTIRDAILTIEQQAAQQARKLAASKFLRLPRGYSNGKVTLDADEFDDALETLWRQPVPETGEAQEP